MINEALEALARVMHSRLSELPAGQQLALLDHLMRMARRWEQRAGKPELPEEDWSDFDEPAGSKQAAEGTVDDLPDIPASIDRRNGPPAWLRG